MDAGNRLPFHNLRSTVPILRQAYISFKSNLFIFSILSLLIFSFRLVVQDGALYITTLIDQDPSFKLLFSLLNHSANHQPRSRPPEELPTTSIMHPGHHPPPPSVLHRTGVGILNEHHLSGDSDDEPSFNGSSKFHHNDSFVIYIYSMWPFSNQEIDNGVKDFEIVRPGFKFKVGIASSARRNGSLDQGKENVTLLQNDYQDLFGVMNKGSFVKEMELSRRDLEGLFFLVSLLDVAHAGAILAFVVTYASVLGVVFVAVVGDFLGRFTRYDITIGKGSILGLERLFGFVLLKWALRDAMTRLLVLCFFYEIGYQSAFSKVFVSLKLLPFSILSSWLKQMPAFVISWFFLDFYVALVLAVYPWVFIAGQRQRGRPEFLDGWFLMRKMYPQVIHIHFLEAIACGSFGKRVVVWLVGRYAAIGILSLVEVYFMVAWLIFYFSARSIDANAQGQRFGRRELQGLMVRLT